MADYPWGEKKEKKKRNAWLKEHKLYASFREIVKSGSSEDEALAMVMEDYVNVQNENKKEEIIGLTKTDYLWAFEHLADDEDEISIDQAPSRMAWSLLKNAKLDPTMARNIEARLGKELFGGDEDDDDSRAYVKSGTAQALKQRFSGILGEIQQLLSRELPRAVGCAER
jgi:hypothetical protein